MVLVVSASLSRSQSAQLSTASVNLSKSHRSIVSRERSESSCSCFSTVPFIWPLVISSPPYAVLFLLFTIREISFETIPITTHDPAEFLIQSLGRAYVFYWDTLRPEAIGCCVIPNQKDIRNIHQPIFFKEQRQLGPVFQFKSDTSQYRLHLLLSLSSYHPSASPPYTAGLSLLSPCDRIRRKGGELFGNR